MSEEKGGFFRAYRQFDHYLERKLNTSSTVFRGNNLKKYQRPQSRSCVKHLILQNSVGETEEKSKSFDIKKSVRPRGSVWRSGLPLMTNQHPATAPIAPTSECEPTVNLTQNWDPIRPQNQQCLGGGALTFCRMSSLLKTFF